MGKRSDFKRRPMDAYQTIDFRAVDILLPFLCNDNVRTFAEPCCGDLQLAQQLIYAGLQCLYAGDIIDGADAMQVQYFGPVDAIITNPPWSRKLLHPMIVHFQRIAPTWLLFDADWCHTKQSAPYLNRCSHIVSVGRLIWIPGTTMTGKDNCCWYKFDDKHTGGPHFYGPRT